MASGGAGEPANTPSREARIETGRRRIRNILTSQTVAQMRTLEQKIADAGPSPQRVDPHLLLAARKALIDTGVLSSTLRAGVAWYFLAGTPGDLVAARLNELLPVYRRGSAHGFTMRMGQALEIAIFRALLAGSPLAFLGAFLQLDGHGDDTAVFHHCGLV